MYRPNNLASLVSFLVLLASVVSAQGPANLSLEEGELAGIPAHWFMPEVSRNAGYEVALVEDDPYEGQRCAAIRQSGAEPPANSFGNLGQSFDAAPFRGQRVRFRAAVRAEVLGPVSRGQLWLRVDRPNQQVGFFDNMGDRPIKELKWATYEIVGDVADDAVAISLGVFLKGRGTLWFDAASFEVIGEAGAGNEPPRALSQRGLDNLVAFARLLGYVRYFHPSDQAAAEDWPAFAIDAVARAETADSPGALVQLLGALFKPLAPTLDVFLTAQPPSPRAAAPPSSESLRLLAWEHHGVDLGNPRNIYTSKRIEISESSAAKDGSNDVELLTKELGSGVTCRLPLAVYADDEGTWPRAAALRLPPRREGLIPSGNDHSTRLADVILAWNVFQHFYPYFDVVEVDWQESLRTALRAAATDADERAFLDTLRRLVADLGDGHGNVYQDSDPQTHQLPILWDWIEDELVVTGVGPGVEGLERGDVVLSVDGKPSGQALADAESLVSAATPQWRRQMGLVALAVGGPGETTELEVRGGDGKVVTLMLAMSAPRSAENRQWEGRPPKVEEIEPGIFYLDLNRVTDADFNDALPRLEQASGLCFDLRGYPQVSPVVISHLIDEPVRSAQWQVPRVTRPDREDMAFDGSGWPVAPIAPRLRAKVAFLTDGRAISYAETYLGIIEHYHLAEIVGSPTAGTNGNINPLRLPGGYQLVWTGMKVLKQDGSQHHGVGIQPTVPAERTIAGVREGRDEVLERALSILRGAPPSNAGSDSPEANTGEDQQ